MSETAQPSPDPLPFHKDPWWHKAVTLTGVLLPFAVTIYAIVMLWGGAVGWLELSLLVFGWIFTGMGISVGFHRMLTHKAFKAKAPVRALWVGLGSLALQGAPADWAATHIRHHAKADQDGDPHSPLEGFFHAHMGWLVRDRFVRSGPVYEGLLEDPVVAFINRTYHWWMLASFAIPAAIGGLVTMSWIGALSGLVWGGAVRVFMGHHITWSVNSISHMFGTRPYETTDEARNNVLVAILGFGEGWHNNHHAFPKAAFLGHTWWQVDPGKWAIKIMEKLGWVWDVWMPDDETRAKRMAA